MSICVDRNLSMYIRLELELEIDRGVTAPYFIYVGMKFSVKSIIEAIKLQTTAHLYSTSNSKEQVIP
ncbi:hypothetical protein QJS04_geneDACA003189 [Acorus gramineus]|uniref:Uncharacterized protein n=1 Tax=Acorus gramineus TaxID=55184 RepID=A0AAV9BXV0_ACOGR|nr:hypothetical protein QJS04_geneDACA003189 [Acorus gramineus]